MQFDYQTNDLWAPVSFSGGGGGGGGGGSDSGRVTARDGSRTNISPEQQNMIGAVAGGVAGGLASRAGPVAGGVVGGTVGTSISNMDNDRFNDVATGLLDGIGGPIADGFGMGL
ncbi:hypothetical protein JANAI62_20350 [Jannaschia pagri]|uniref:Glycine zipper domain-containing protein n=1 Tax=Jannaschia pagri TaxID=2829797 RepID=A0ABQ4NMS7_9RHOB|nr:MULTISPECIES: hypothetical protein [unclassified Jannaschia]GIT91578.1 hypothetical protein JANAI61_20360 [Jannaschia sp. AI_61]GIT95412.1 hypothetical protein JANAI62_20350 [Jannaschia sp. AI_62]